MKLNMYFLPFTLDGNWQYRYSHDQLYRQTIRCIKLKSFFKIQGLSTFLNTSAHKYCSFQEIQAMSLCDKRSGRSLRGHLSQIGHDL